MPLEIISIVYTKTRKGHYVFSKIMLSLPMLGKVYSQAFIATFCSTMSTLLTAGVSVLEVFDILSGMTSNDIIRDAIVTTRERIVGGLNIHLSMSESRFFPNLVVKMIQVGEESGSLSPRPSILLKRSVRGSPMPTISGTMTVGCSTWCIGMSARPTF